MKKIYALSLCSLLCVSASASEGRFKTKKGTPVRHTLKIDAASAPVWRPATQNDYLYDGNDWMLVAETRFVYDAKGNAIRQDIKDEDGLYRMETQFSEYGKPVSILSTVDFGDGWLNDSKRTYKYDDVLHDFYIERLGFDWDYDEEEWVANYYCETNTIIRNADGNITSIEKALPYIDDMVPAYKAVWNYKDGASQADAFAYYANYNMNGEPEWRLYDGSSYGNIEWEETNGQIVGTSMKELLSGANRIKSAEVYYDNELDGHVFVTYSTTNAGDYLYKETYADPTVVGYTVSRETIDANGSFREIQSEYFDEDGEPTDEPIYQIIHEVTCDKYGNPVLEEIYEAFDGMKELADGVKFDYEYDNNGNPLEIITSIYDYDEDEYFYESRIVYGEYKDVTGIDDIAVDSSEKTVDVYNIQGILVKKGVAADSVGNLPAGLYIINGRKQIVR